MQRIESLTEILPYVRAFQGATFVVKLGGEVCREPHLDEVAQQVSLIHHVGIRTVLVHGGGPQMDDLLARLGVERRVVAGRRITDDETLAAAKMVYAGLINTDVVCALGRHGAAAVGLTGCDARLVTARRRPVRDMTDDAGNAVRVDFGHVGDVEAVDPAVIHLLLRAGFVPVVGSLAGDAQGHAYNVNADAGASRIAQALGARKLILMTNVPGVLNDPANRASVISYADVESLTAMVEDRRISGGMLPKVAACIEAVKNGVARTHIVDGTRPGALLLEIFVNEGCGTMIVDKKERQQYETEVRSPGKG